MKSLFYLPTIYFVIFAAIMGLINAPQPDWYWGMVVLGILWGIFE